ncbi:MAG: hypothetical protein ACO1RX_18200 [Candidatus Sericytochromatia bacterium]
MNVRSIYGAEVSPQESAQWLKNNPRAATHPELLKVADYNANGSIDNVELSEAANNRVVVLDGIRSFKLIDENGAAQAPASPGKKAAVGAAVVGAGVAVGAGIVIFDVLKNMR